MYLSKVVVESNNSQKEFGRVKDWSLTVLSIISAIESQLALLGCALPITLDSHVCSHGNRELKEANARQAGGECQRLMCAQAILAG